MPKAMNPKIPSVSVLVFINYVNVFKKVIGDYIHLGSWE